MANATKLVDLADRIITGTMKEYTTVLWREMAYFSEYLYDAADDGMEKMAEYHAALFCMEYEPD